MINKNQSSLIASKLNHSIEYFMERINTLPSNSDFSEYYTNAIHDLLMVDELATLTYIKNLKNIYALNYIMPCLRVQLIYRFPTKRLLKVCREQIDRCTDSYLRDRYIEEYEDAAEYLQWLRQDKIKTQNYLNMMVHNHTERNLRYLRSQGFEVNIECIYTNGVRLGSVPMHPDEQCRKNMTWFPTSWKLRDLDKAVQFVYKQHKSIFADLADESEVSASFKGVKVVIRKSTRHTPRYWQYDIGSVFPDKQQ